ncbi:hypothetical protein E2C01_067543 [Portunus trituberculatus]|uniref:Uncharacterized protein n=1 Tax=Portunus trituberculatus TaxID=210409 RepID=A0A5B7HK24_PORTR|nr:hypothetical protein [Portunus trituberculatus]
MSSTQMQRGNLPCPSPHVAIRSDDVEHGLGYFTMLLKVFYSIVILIKETAVAFLRKHNLLDTVQQADPYHKSGSVMEEKRKRNRGGEFKPVHYIVQRGVSNYVHGLFVIFSII